MLFNQSGPGSSLVGTGICKQKEPKLTPLYFSIAVSVILAIVIYTTILHGCQRRHEGLSEVDWSLTIFSKPPCITISHKHREFSTYNKQERRSLHTLPHQVCMLSYLVINKHIFFFACQDIKVNLPSLSATLGKNKILVGR